MPLPPGGSYPHEPPFLDTKNLQVSDSALKTPYCKLPVYFDKSPDMIYKTSWLKIFNSAVKNELKPSFIFFIQGDKNNSE
jgi:hypothetical protein